MKTNSGNVGLLQGIRVLDLTTVVMGPLATQILGDMGADVIKIEAISGDISRQSVPSRNKGMGQAFLAHNRNKRSVALDLKTREGKAALLKLCENADVLVYNVRPQAMARLGLTYEDVKAVNDRIIYVGGFGFSQRGPYAAKAAYDDVLQGMSGVPWLFAQATGQSPAYAPMTFCDRTVAIHVVVAVLGALFHRQVHGVGQSVDVPMFENLVLPILAEHFEGETFFPPLGPMGHARSLSPDRKPYPTQDGYISVLIYNDRQWHVFLDLIDRSDVLSDPRFINHSARLRHIDEVNAFLSAELGRRSTADWLELFEKHDLPAGPMNSLEDVHKDPHLNAIGFFKDVPHPTEGTVRAMVYPTEWSAATNEIRRHAPALGEHTYELLLETGYSRSDIDELIASGAAVGISKQSMLPLEEEST